MLEWSIPYLLSMDLVHHTTGLHNPLPKCESHLKVRRGIPSINQSSDKFPKCALMYDVQFCKLKIDFYVVEEREIAIREEI